MDQNKDKLDINLKVNGISYHAFSPDFKFIAIALKKEPVLEIYEIVDFMNKSKWKLVKRITEPYQTISSVDWSINNKILATSFDRAVYIYNYPSFDRDLTITHNKKAVLGGIWHAKGKKFAIATGDHKPFIGYWE